MENNINDIFNICKEFIVVFEYKPDTKSLDFIHICGFEKKVQDKDIEDLKLELQTDLEFGANTKDFNNLHFVILDKNKTLDLMQKNILPEK